MYLDSLIESLLLEGVTLTKGSQRVMNDKKLVPALAQTVRDDAVVNPASFPPGSKNNFKKASDEEVAHWFLENLDNIERAGYEGAVYSRDGANSDWITRRYIAGSHNWEDITGVLNMNLFDWYALKNRDALDTNHQQISKFTSIRQIGSYMVTHYRQELEQTRDAAKNAAKDKLAKAIPLVDNEDYKIFCTLNRIAGCKLGRGTQWCTANTTTDQHYHRYSNEAMLFQLFPKNPEQVSKTSGFNGRKTEGSEKYQFGADNNGSFMDIADDPVPKNVVRTKFPYLYSDLVDALTKNKSKIDTAIEKLSADPTLQTTDTKVKNYNVDDEIRKLHRFVDRGFFTDEARPPKSADPALEQPPPAPQENPMEDIKSLAKSMLEDVTLGHIVQQYKPANSDGKESPLTYGDDNLDEAEPGMAGDAKSRLVQTLMSRQAAIDEEDAMAAPAPGAAPMPGGEVGGQAQTGGTLGGAGGGMGGGGQYAPGTAPTMPESIQTRNNMKKIKEDTRYGSQDFGDETVATMIRAYKTIKQGGHWNPDTLLDTLNDSYEEDVESCGGDEERANTALGRTLAHDFVDYVMSSKDIPKASTQYLSKLRDAIRQRQSGLETLYNGPEFNARSNLPNHNTGKETTMENVDKDVAAMLKTLKKYDKLTESVLGMTTVGMARNVAEDTSQQRGQANDQKHAEDAFTANRAKKRNDSDEAWAKSQGKLKEESGPAKKDVPAFLRKEKGGDWKTSKDDLEKEKDDKISDPKTLAKNNGTKVDESAGVDPEILEWMGRFAKLGNMKGYGR